MNVTLNFSRFCNMTLGMMKHTGSIMAQIVNAGEVLTAESKDIISRFFNSSAWLQRSGETFLERHEIPTEMLYAAAALSVLIFVMFIWFVMTGKEERVHDLGSLQQSEVISIFDLAKTAYLPGHTEHVITLVTKLQFDVNFPIPTNGMTLFLCACISGSTKLVSFLLDQGGDATITNKDGDTPLYLATFTCAGSSCSDFSLIRTLICAGCDVNTQNHKGNTPLHWAASKGDVELIKFLLSCGSDRYIKNNICMYPIGMATNNGHLRAGKHLKISIPDNPSPWDMFEPNTPVKVRLGLLPPHRDRLAMSPRPRMKLNFS